MDDAADHTPVVHPRLAARVRRQKRRKSPHLRLAQPEQSAHPHALVAERESHQHEPLKDLYEFEA